jgi:hypothetical protein
MGYASEIVKNEPMLLLFLIDQSGSMAGALPDQPNRRKADVLADVINDVLRGLIMRCARGESVDDYFNVAIIGYGHKLGSAFSGSLSGCDVVPISALAKMGTRVIKDVKTSNEEAGFAIEQAIRTTRWFDSIAEGGVPMRNAFAQTHTCLQRWLEQHPDCSPPVVIHISNGRSTDGDPAKLMKATASLRSSGGSVLLFNIHISSDASSASISFPDSTATLPSRDATILFECASPLTYPMRMIANSKHGMDLSDGTRGFVFNGDAALVVRALDVMTGIPLPNTPRLLG